MTQRSQALKAVLFAVALAALPVSAQTCSVPTAFYVATNGNDSNPGTLANPFLTLGKAQTAMRNSSTKITNLRAGTYKYPALTLTSADNNETWETYPCDAAQSASLVYNGTGSPLFDIVGGSGITITNFTWNGGTRGGARYSAAIVAEQGSNNIHVTSSKFLNNSIQSDLYIYNSDNIYFQGNTSGPNELHPVSAHI